MARTGGFRQRVRQSRALYLMFCLPFLYFAIFHYVPMFGNLMAFENYDISKGVFRSEWAGFKYFNEFLTNSYFWHVVANTVILNAYSLLFVFPAPILFALLLNELTSGVFKRFVQTITYVPHFLSTVVVAGMLANFLTIDGLVNQIVKWFGGTPQVFLSLPHYFRTIYISSDIWQLLGWNSIIYLAALTSVNPQLYEAATTDGAGRWKKMWHITIPGIANVVTIMFLLNIGHLLTVGFEKVLLLYSGPTYETADVIQTFIYRRGLIDSDFSFAAAVGIFQSVLACLLVLAANQISKKVQGARLF